jgi:hypothetical protein
MRWTGKLAMTPRELRLLVESEDQGDLVKARLPARPGHPRALLTMLEGLALWNGHRLRVVISADESAQVGCALGLFGDELWPMGSALVQFDPAVPGRRRRLRGLGDFRAVRRGTTHTDRGEP